MGKSLLGRDGRQSISRRQNRKQHGTSHKGMMCLENLKYPSDYTVGAGLGGGRVGRVWTENILRSEISKGPNWDFKDFKINTEGKKKTEWVLAGVA